MTREEVEKIVNDAREKGETPDLQSANLRDANLHGANLRNANLHGANLSGANLQGADLTGADLSDANLRDANLHGANLRNANLHGANLQGAKLTRANLTGTNLDYASGIPLHCGGAHFKCGISLVHQLLAHICTLEVTDEPLELSKIKDFIKPFAMKSHIAKDLGITK